MTDVSEELNNYKKKYEDGIKLQENLIKAVLTNCDKELLIKILKKRGIIKRDWLQKNQVYEMSIPLNKQGKQIR